MIRGPKPGAAGADFEAKARAARGGEAQDWVLALAREATQRGQKAAGELIGYSGSTVSEIISDRYRGNSAAVEDAVRVHLMGATVECPIFAKAIGIDRCREQQGRAFSSSSPLAGRMARTCADCPHARKESANG